MVTATRFSRCLLKRDNQDRVGVACGGVVSGALITRSSSAVRMSVSGCCLALYSVNSTIMCVGWLTVADFRPGPLT